MAVIQGWQLFRGLVTVEAYVARFNLDQNFWLVYIYRRWLLFWGTWTLEVLDCKGIAFSSVSLYMDFMYHRLLL